MHKHYAQTVRFTDRIYLVHIELRMLDFIPEINAINYNIVERAYTQYVLQMYTFVMIQYNRIK